MKFFDPLSNKATLSNYSVTDMVQDSMGYIWISTSDGLNSYNGYEIKIYRHDQTDSASLVNNSVLDLFIDNKNRMWVATKIGLCIYDGEMDNFKVLLSNDEFPGVVSPYITSVNQDRDSVIYISTENFIYTFDEETESFHHFLEIEKGEISAFVFDEENNVWIGATQEGGLTFYDRNTRATKVYYHQVDDPNSLSHDDIRDLTIYNGYLWLATYGGGINTLDLSNFEFKTYPSEGSYDIYTVDTYIDKDQRLWVSSLTSIKLYDKDKDIFYSYFSQLDDDNEIKENPVGIFQDSQGNYWSMHSPGGIALREVPRGFNILNTDPSLELRTSNDNITAITTDALGNWWVGNYNNGIDIFDWLKDRTVTFEFDENDPHSLGQGTIFTIYYDSHSINWIGSNLGGLQYFNVSDSNFYSYTHDPRNPNSIANNDVRDIIEDKDGNLWVVVHGRGIDKFIRDKKIFEHYNQENNNLTNNWTYEVLIDSEENLWVGTSWGLNKLVAGEDTFKNYYYVPDDTNSLSDNDIIALFEDSQNQLWVGTSGGLNKYNKETDDFTRYNRIFKNNYICAINEDEDQILWVSTHGGISSFNPNTLQVLNFTQSDGLQPREFNPRATFKNAENTLFFGGLGGVNFFNPDQLFYNQEKPRVIISGLKLFNESVDHRGENGILDKHISYVDEVFLDYSHKVIGIEYFALNFINPEQNTYKYKLEGFDMSWNDVGSKREATYTNLNPGLYTFKVKAANNDKIWNEEGASLSIRVLPPWWMTWWFKLLTVGVVAIILVSFYFIRTAQLRNQKVVLTQMVEERTKSLNEKNELLRQQSEDLNEVNALLEERQQQIEEQAARLEKQTEDLKAKNKQLKHLNVTKDRLFSIVAHDLRNPFHGILSLTDMFYSKFDLLTDEDKSQMAYYINNSARVIYNLLDNLLNWARSQTNEIIFKPVDTDIYELISESLKLLETNAEEKDITIDVIKESDVIVKIDRDMINTTIRNLLSNAIKFTPKKGRIAISIEDKVKYAEVAISDTGIGMDDKIIQNLFNIDKKSSRAGTEGERGSALGLVLCKDFVERNGGKIEVKSKPNEGSTFRLILPKSENKSA